MIRRSFTIRLKKVVGTMLFLALIPGLLLIDWGSVMGCFLDLVTLMMAWVCMNFVVELLARTGTGASVP